MPVSSDREEPARGGNADSRGGPEPLRLQVRHAAREVESKIIRNALEQHHWNRRRAAAALQISYRSLMYKMKICNLRDSGPDGGGQS